MLRSIDRVKGRGRCSGNGRGMFRGRSKASLELCLRKAFFFFHS